VIRYRGTEGLCQLYRFEIELASTKIDRPADGLVGKPATLSIFTDFGERWFHGIISRIEVTGENVGQSAGGYQVVWTYFRAELVPAVWLLTHRYSSRIFQNKTVPEIISDVLTKAGITGDQFALEGLSRSYQPREYCVQYRETDYNFICRLMEEEGIRWYFEQSQGAHTLILADGNPASYADIEGEAGEEVLPYRAHVGSIA
jgi:type VI secretion system secreted protein VgrG